jgi:O-antigen/teichoic acid export membrane protein
MHKTINNLKMYLIHIVLGGLFTISLMSVASNHLEAEEFGWFVLAQVYSLIAVGIANLGVLTAYDRNFFIYEKDIKKSAQLITSSLLFVLINLLTLLGVIYFYQTDITLLIIADNAPKEMLFIVLCGSAISSLAQYYLTFLKNSSLARHFMQFSLLQILINFTIALFLLLTTSLKSLSLAYAWLFSNAILLLSLAVFYKKLLTTFSSTLLKEVLNISLPLTPRVFFGFINTQFDKIMLGMIASTGSVAIYSIGQTISLTIFQFMTAMGRLFQPEMYRKLFANKQQTHVDEIHNYILPFFYVSIFMALLVAIFAKEFVVLFFPEKYAGATIVIIILSIYYVVLFFGKITGNQLIYAKKMHLSSLLMLVGIIFNVALNIPFIMKWGMVGAAWATTISGIIIGLISYFLAQKYAKIIWQWSAFWSIYAVFFLAAVFAFIEVQYLSIEYYWTIIIKLLLIASYILLGFIMEIITVEKVRHIFKILN